MKSIGTLVQDIYDLFTKPFTVQEDIAEDFGKKLAKHIVSRIQDERAKPALRMSNLGTPDCKLWYQINTPELAEPMPPEARIKFLFGDIIEEFLLFLAKLAGHDVKGEQDECSIDGIKGHRDAVIDGRLIDCKSASSFSFRKFQDHGLKEDDPFGYIDQLNSYLYATANDPLVLDKNKGSFLVMDKTLGKICLDTYQKNKVDYTKLIAEKRTMLSSSTKPSRAFQDIDEGKSGNKKLCMQCSYCSFKHTCWPGLRVFLYSNKPVFLTQVNREPKVPELKSNE